MKSLWPQSVATQPMIRNIINSCIFTSGIQGRPTHMFDMRGSRFEVFDGVATPI